MRCPFCRKVDNRVTDSRMSGDGATIRRRRVCGSCQRRFTTYERVEETAPMVVKKDNRREAFDRNKVVAGITRACEKRPVSTETIAQICDRIEAALAERGSREVPSSFIGSAVMDELRRIDQVAYVRFASVYRSFKDIEEFMRELEELLEKRKRGALGGSREGAPEASGPLLDLTASGERHRQS
ncbi:MAG TPA: transcriptional regulator NrdR [Candidatus Binataceae bacterium]|nr:transcriptional regulator NrdR [Candidatus Binataceae bacterium]